MATDPELPLSSKMWATVDASGRVESLSPAWGDLLGIPLEEMRSSLLHRMFHPDDRARIRRALRILSRGQSVPPLEVRCRRRDGVCVRIALRMAVLFLDRVYVVAGREIPRVRPRRAEEGS